jgi:hypothetical protein
VIRTHLSRVYIPLSLLILLGLQAQGISGWYDPEWSTRKPIIVDNLANGETLINYQIEVTIPYASEMQIDFDDIRFTSDDESTSIPLSQYLCTRRSRAAYENQAILQGL